jgi:chromosome segregation ATPase
LEVVNLKRRGGILSMTTDDGSRQLEIERSAHHETRRELEASHHLLRDMETRLQHAQMTILELREQLAEATKPKVLPAVVAKASHPPKVRNQKAAENKPVKWWEQNWRAKFGKPGDVIA